MIVKYYIEIEHQRGSWLQRISMPWRNRYWLGSFGAYATPQEAYKHVNNMLDEAEAEDSASDRCTGRWRIVKHTSVPNRTLAQVVGGDEFARVLLWGRGHTTEEELNNG